MLAHLVAPTHNGAAGGGPGWSPAQPGPPVKNRPGPRAACFDRFGRHELADFAAAAPLSVR